MILTNKDEDLKQTILDFINKQGNVVVEYLIRPIMKGTEYTGKINIEIVIENPIYEHSTSKK